MTPVQDREERAELAAAAQRHPGGALDHAHEQAGADAVARDVDDVGGPPLRGLDHVDEIAADVAARHRQAAHLDPADALRQRRHQDPVDLARQIDLGTEPAVARALDADESSTAA